MAKENIEKKINSLLNELQNETGASDQEIINFKKILDLADTSELKIN